eukprot:TRINITY_DN11246_c1_g1_i1.p1 TRINITY_DN11246_c1_g1~~TRINITY_DN11246_c1_g1_i1.p1  ORF type:complete len:617 (+),score=98.52 TRINITY_DN11246_c1_g1_i1:101-1951(+)
MPSPRDRPGRDLQQPAGVCWPMCASNRPPRIIDRRAPDLAVVPEKEFATSYGFDVPAMSLDMPPKHAPEAPLSTLGGHDPLTSGGLRAELITMQKQLEALVNGQAELQAVMIRVSLQIGTEIGNRHGSMEVKRSPPSSPALSTEKNDKQEQRENHKASQRSSFSPAEDIASQLKKDALQKLFKVAEECEDKRRKKGSPMGMVSEVRSRFTGESMEITVDSIMAIVIFINAIFLGISVDYKDGSLAWLVVDCFFSCSFVAELAFKIWINGARAHFCGRTPGSQSAQSAIGSFLDATLIVADFVQLVLEITKFDVPPPSASLFRTVRLLKIARVLRLLKTDVFKDLLDMIQGILGGLSTLAWSMVFFLLVVYSMALIFRELLGNRNAEHVSGMFDTVPRSMYTTFRCSFGDCSTPGGMPIFEYVYIEFGFFENFLYCLFVFCVTIGLFNVISAIFVESTMSAAQKMEQEKRGKRMQDEQLLATRVTQLIRCLLKYSPGHSHLLECIGLSEEVDALCATEVPRCVVDEAVKDPEAINALNELDINPSDRARLSDIFDPDNGGTVQLSDVAAGIRRLRGDPRRSDIVCVDLMIRSLQSQMEHVLHAVDAFTQDFSEQFLA